MSKIFGRSMKNIGSNVGLLTEDNEKFTVETRPSVQNDSDVFVKPSVPKVSSYRSITTKSGSLFRNVGAFETFEELSKIDFEPNSFQNLNEPSTSASFQPIKRQNEPSYREFGFARRQDNRLFCPTPRKTLFNSKMQYRGQDACTERNNDDLSSSKKFGLDMRNSLLSSIRFSESNSTCDENYQRNNDGSLTNKFGLGLRNNPLNSTGSLENLNKINSIVSLKNSTLLPGLSNSKSRIPMEEHGQFARDKYIHASVENFRNRNNLVIASTPSRSGIRNNIFCGTDSTMDKTRLIEENRNSDSCFVKPSLSKFIRPRMTTMSSRLFNPSFEQNITDTSTSSRFKATHIPRRDFDTLSDSKLVPTRDNMLESMSVAGVPVISVRMAMNIVENLHHSMLYAAPNVPVEKIKKVIDQAKEMIENRSEISFAHSVKDVDGVSVTSYSSKPVGYNLMDKQSEKCLDEINLKSGKDILNLLTLKEGSGKTKKLSSIQEEKSSSQKTIGDQILEDEEDSALIFKKPKQIFQNHKKNILKIKTPQPQKNHLTRESKKIINLKKWYPVILGEALAFKGTAENGTVEQTEAVKKRLTNRKMVLINGLECNLIGSPLDTIISNFPKSLASRLADGLTSRWRMFQKELNDYQFKSKNKNLLKWIEKEKKSPRKSLTRSGKGKNGKETETTEDGKKKKEEEEEGENIKIYDSTPKTRRKSPLTKKTGKNVKRVQTSVKVAVKKINARKSFGGNKSVQNKSHNKSKRKSPKENEKSVSLEKSQKITPNQRRDTPLNAANAKKNIVDSVSRTRSGRAVKPTKFFRGESAEKENSNSMETPKGVTNGSGKSKNNSNSKKTPPSVKETKSAERESRLVPGVPSSTESEKNRMNLRSELGKRKREISGEADSAQRKKTKVEESPAPTKSPKAKSPEKSSKKSQELKKDNKNAQNKILQKSKAQSKTNKTKSKKKSVTSSENKQNGNVLEVKSTTFTTEFEDVSALQLDDIEIPERGNMSGKIKLNRSQLRHMCAETPPLKYFNSNLKLLKNATPVSSPNWCISQRTETEVKHFQRRQVMAQKKKTIVQENKKTVTKGKGVMKNRDLRNMLNWVADKTVRTPTGNSKLLKYMIPSRKQMELEDDEEIDDEEEDVANGPFEP